MLNYWVFDKKKKRVLFQLLRNMAAQSTQKVAIWQQQYSIIYTVDQQALVRPTCRVRAKIYTEAYTFLRLIFVRIEQRWKRKADCSLIVFYLLKVVLQFDDYKYIRVTQCEWSARQAQEVDRCWLPKNIPYKIKCWRILDEMLLVRAQDLECASADLTLCLSSLYKLLDAAECC